MNCRSSCWWSAASLLSIVTLLLVSLIIFSMLEVLPGDVATRILGRDATPESLEVLRTELGLDRPAAGPLPRLARGPGHRRSRQIAGLQPRRSSEILAPRIFNTLLLSLYAFVALSSAHRHPAVLQALTARPRSRPRAVGGDARAAVDAGFPSRHHPAADLRAVDPGAAGHLAGRRIPRAGSSISGR